MCPDGGSTVSALVQESGRLAAPAPSAAPPPGAKPAPGGAKAPGAPPTPGTKPGPGGAKAPGAPPTPGAPPAPGMAPAPASGPAALPARGGIPGGPPPAGPGYTGAAAGADGPGCDHPLVAFGGAASIGRVGNADVSVDRPVSAGRGWNFGAATAHRAACEPPGLVCIGPKNSSSGSASMPY